MAEDKKSTVIAELAGVDSVVAGAERIKSAWAGAGSSITSSFGSAGSAVSGALQGVIQDVAHVVTAIGTINTVAAIGQVRNFESSIADLAPIMGKSFEDTQRLINNTAKSINEMPQATEVWMATVGRLTNSYGQLENSIKNAKEYALATGQSLSATTPVIGALSQLTGPGIDPSQSLKEIQKAAAVYNTPGGAQAVQDILQTIAPILAKTGGQTPEDLIRFSAAIDPLGSPAHRKETATKLASELASTSDFRARIGYTRTLGHDVRDEAGNAMPLSAFAQERQAMEVATRGKDQLTTQGTWLALQSTYGSVAAQGLMSTKWLSPLSTDNVLLNDFLEKRKQSAVGEYEQASITGSLVMQEKFSHDAITGKGVDVVHKFGAEHPGLMGIVPGVVSNLASKGIGLLGGGASAAAKLLGRGAAVEGAEAAMSAAPGVATGAGIAASGLGLGVGAVGAAASLKVLYDLGEGSSPEAQGLKVKALAGDPAAAARLAEMAKEAQQRGQEIRNPSPSRPYSQENYGSFANPGGAAGSDTAKLTTAIDNLNQTIKTQNSSRKQEIIIKDKTTNGIQKSSSDNLDAGHQ